MGQKYLYIIKSWRANRENLSTFFEFSFEIRKIIYTTNLIENITWGIRRYTRTKGSLPGDQAVEKIDYLSLMRAQKKWTIP